MGVQWEYRNNQEFDINPSCLAHPRELLKRTLSSYWIVKLWECPVPGEFSTENPSGENLQWGFV